MAVIYDTSFADGVSAASPFSFTSGAGATQAGSVGNNSDRVLIGYAQFNQSVATIGTVTMSWDGKAMTAIGTGLDVTGGLCLFCFGLKTDASVSTGSKVLGATWTGPAAVISLGAISLYGADTTVGWNNNTTNTGNSTAFTITITTNPGDMPIAGLTDNNTISTVEKGIALYKEQRFSGDYGAAMNPYSGVISGRLRDSVGWGLIGVNVPQKATSAAATTPLMWDYI